MIETKISDSITMTNRYKSYALHNFKQIPQIAKLSEGEQFAIEVVGNVLPFKANNYVVNELIDWDNVQNDPIFKLTFPQKEMLQPHHFEEMTAVLRKNGDRNAIRATANKIRLQLNPHPAGQIEHNIPSLNGVKLAGMQHKYRETVLFFPSQGQTCHAYCTFCFRWPQFVGMDELKFATRETELLIQYLKRHPEVTDLIFTGGDPLIMNAQTLASYIEPILRNDLENIQTIRIGTKAFSFWPYKFLTDNDADDLLSLFTKVVRAGKNLSIMTHFNHPVELSTIAVKDAISRLRSTGAQIRTQSPLLRHVNDSGKIWAEMLRKQINLNCIPYYMFIARNTGAQHYFATPLVEAWRIFRETYQQVSGICRTLRGPTMSCNSGKIQVLGVSDVAAEKVIALRFIQARNPDWVCRPFFAEYDENATWFDELNPAFGEEKFFFEDEFDQTFDEPSLENETVNFE